MNDPSRGQPHGLSMAMRMSTDLVAAVFVGGGIGYLIDYWFNTKPWLTVIFFLFGLAAGFRNMYRSAMQGLPSQEGKGQGESTRTGGHSEEPPR
ncbi:MAG: AtpZ/AtpI family protein [Magnetococcus sp. YQC-9]